MAAIIIGTILMVSMTVTMAAMITLPTFPTFKVGCEHPLAAQTWTACMELNNAPSPENQIQGNQSASLSHNQTLPPPKP